MLSVIDDPDIQKKCSEIFASNGSNVLSSFTPSLYVPSNKINLGSTPTSTQIDPRAIERLKTDPDGLREAFDKKYGAGSANRVLGQQ